MDILRHNETIARRFFEIEKRILKVLNFKDFFEVLLAEIRRHFKVPYAWITLIEGSEIEQLIRHSEISAQLRAQLNIIGRTDFEHLVGTQSTPLLVNQELKTYDGLLPRECKYVVKSIAIAPIYLDGKLIGSLNQADISSRRFQPGIDTSLLEQLAVKVSLCLSNVTAHEKLRFLAYHDPLTGLLNRRVMESVLEREFARYQRYPQIMSLVFLDLDYFKHVNDVYGHDRGDDLLVHVANGLLQMSRTTDVVSRYAGDEFVIILPQTKKDSADQLMHRICSDFSRRPLQSKGLVIPVSISFGIASTDDKGVHDPASLVKKADENLYEAKKSRRKPPPHHSPVKPAGKTMLGIPVGKNRG
jgi:diguanylate cyclase (GGDEF)-like protein